MALVSLDDYEKKAREVLDIPALDYYRSGAGNELSLFLNRSCFDKYDCY
jgi:(S)-2-hydroxy-acid oxidase